jgi:tetratricopeptide (TPR) repeat protein
VEESLALYRQLEDKRGIAWALRMRAPLAANEEGDYEQSISLLEQSLALAEEVGDKVNLTFLHEWLGWQMMFGGDYPRATKLAERGMAFAHETGDQRALARLKTLLADTAVRQREYAQAEALYLDALALFRGLKAGRDVSWTLHELGKVARLQKEYERAATYCQEGLTHARERPVAYLLYGLGHAVVRQGDHQRATALFRESLDRARARSAREQKSLVRWILWGFALVAAEARARRAAILYAVVEPLFELPNWVWYLGDTEDYAGDVAFAREQLGEVAFAAAWAEGQAMSLEQAVAFALEEGDEFVGARQPYNVNW